jgi:C-terminal processing protease CtpA/Prc
LRIWRNLFPEARFFLTLFFVFSPDLARYKNAMEQANCTIERVEALPHNIGYLKLNSFPDSSICRARVAAAMASLNHADAIIFDLRDNRGGQPTMVLLVASYLCVPATP